MTLFSELKDANPRLYWDAVCRDKVSYSEAGALTPGNVVTNTFIEGVLGGPHGQENSGYNPLTTDIIGAGTGYPKPWRSASQKLQDQSYGSTIGPFARIVTSSIPPQESFPGTCCDNKKMPNPPKPCGEGIFGRIGIGDGNHLGFRAQDWHGQAEGTYNTAYWQNQGANWDTWKDWWDNCTKTTITCIWEDIPGNPEIQVEVANDYIDIGDDDYFPGLDGKVYLDASLDLLVAMVALAVFVRW